MKYLLAGLTFILVFVFFIALALGWVYAGSGSIEFGKQLQGALFISMNLGIVVSPLAAFYILDEHK